MYEHTRGSNVLPPYISRGDRSWMSRLLWKLNIITCILYADTALNYGNIYKAK